MWWNNLDIWLSCQFISGLHTLCSDLLWFFFIIFFFITVSNCSHVIAIFGNHVTTATSSKTDWLSACLCQITSKIGSDSEEIMASKVGVLPLKGQVSDNVSMLKVIRRMRSHPMGLDIWFLVRLFIYFHTSCVQTAKALAKHGCAGSHELSLVACGKYLAHFIFACMFLVLCSYL